MRSRNQGKVVHELLNLNRLRWELLLESTIWDHRLHSLLCSNLISTSFSMRTSEQSDLGQENEGDHSLIDFPVREIPVEGHVQEDGVISANEVPIEDQVSEEKDDSSTTSTVADNIENEEVVPSSSVNLDQLKRLSSQSSSLSTLKGSNGWFWRPFSKIRPIYLSDIQGGYFPRIEPLSGKTLEYLPRTRQLIFEEGSRIHVSFENGNKHTYTVSDYEGEISSIIACALALLKDRPPEPEIAADGMQNLIHIPSVTPTQSSSYVSFNSELGSPSPLEGSQFSSFDGLALLDSLLASERYKVDVSLGVTRSMTKGKYSVVCLYADQFQELRSQCCPSEVDFIASLARCRNWDAKGGKSKSVFAKTLDDRFIIKEIKKTEFESFEKFAPHYFNHLMQCFHNGNQTCLAKVFGIFQV